MTRSPSPRRAWIEIIRPYILTPRELVSPSPRRAWIEMSTYDTAQMSRLIVALPTEGVD